MMDKREPPRADTLSEVQAMLSSTFELPMERLQPEQSLEELGIDSLSAIEFIFEVEDKFAITVAERPQVATVNDIAVLVDAAMETQAHPA
jgi:acyl carrier protein